MVNPRLEPLGSSNSPNFPLNPDTGPELVAIDFNLRKRNLNRLGAIVGIGLVQSMKKDTIPID